jgi:nucleoside-diphosphate-sugar epimerase
MSFLGNARSSAIQVTTLRVPGIYALDRENGTPEARLKKGTPVLEPSADVYTNHIQADDLARACWTAVWRGPTQRAINTSDDTQMRMGEYMDWAADHFHLERAPRMGLEEALRTLPPMQLSFMQESRRLLNHRLKKELKLSLKYPTIKEGLSLKEST